MRQIAILRRAPRHRVTLIAARINRSQWNRRRTCWVGVSPGDTFLEVIAGRLSRPPRICPGSPQSWARTAWWRSKLVLQQIRSAVSGWERHNSILNCRGVSRAETYPACAGFKFGDGRLGDVRCAADIPLGIFGARGTFMALAPEAGIPGLLREGALEVLGGRRLFTRNIRTLRRRGVDIPLELNGTGRPKSVVRPARSASYFGGAFRISVRI